MSPREPIVVINGIALTEAQAMAVRVAVTTFQGFEAPHLGEIGKLYGDRLAEVLSYMSCPCGRCTPTYTGNQP